MRYHKIPRKLKEKVRNYFYHRYQGRLFNEKTLLKELSHVLEEVCTEKYDQKGANFPNRWRLPPHLSIIIIMPQTFTSALSSRSLGPRSPNITLPILLIMS